MLQNILVLWLATTLVLAVSPLVDLNYTKYQGRTLGNGVNQWLGIRYAAPCNGTNRFRLPQSPLALNGTQDATKEGALCLSANSQEGLQYESERQPMAEDCLFLGIYAPANATAQSKLPVMFFIQGGGFGSNSNGNFNGTGLVEASGNNMVVVRINYRVGILGFIGGLLPNAAPQPNLGLYDMVAAARWAKEHIAAFGGDPDHMVLSGVSSGGNAIDILLTANNGTGFPDLFVGAAVESTGWGSDPLPQARESQLTAAMNATGCLDATDAIDCMRALPIAEFQKALPQGGWGATIDGKMLTAPHYQMMEANLFQKVPVIFGTTSNEATPSYIANPDAATEEDIRKSILNQFPSITDVQLSTYLAAYPESLNNISFYGRDVSSKNDTLRIGKGAEWQRDVAFRTEIAQCTAGFFSDMFAAVGSPTTHNQYQVNKLYKANSTRPNPALKNFHYRYNIMDSTPGGQEAQGLFSPHASELYSIWGLGNTDGGDPACFKLPTSDPLSCAYGGRITQAYWISFIRSLDPNTYRLAGSPEWKSWTIEEPNRIVLDNTEAEVEVVGRGKGEIVLAGLNQRQRCLGFVTQLSKTGNAGLKAGQVLPPFANGTRVDPTLIALVTAGNSTSQAVQPQGNKTRSGERGGRRYGQRSAKAL